MQLVAVEADVVTSNQVNINNWLPGHPRQSNSADVGAQVVSLERYSGIELMKLFHQIRMLLRFDPAK